MKVQNALRKEMARTAMQHTTKSNTPPVNGSSRRGSTAGNSNRDVRLFINFSKGVK